MSNLQDIGGMIDVVSSIRPVASAAAGSYSLVGAAVDTKGFESAVLAVSTGAATGTPSALAVDVKLQECDTSGGSYSDVADAAISQITAVNTDGRVSVKLTGLKRYVKAVATVAFTGGSTPTVGVKADVILGGARVLPTS